ncbi:MAG: hypothetical protein COW79_01760 [Bdellovibrionales bacterium CG22_combo_CG10-13_8_21_14_all_38_13]|nr:MAG: hypothetical protein COW79_01760 [Bdellovibrionales bacterium CG22_combo_CG10-13_8_21_14_all_38_13]
MYDIDMSQIFIKLPFLIELFFNGLFILVYSLKLTDRLPRTWSIDYVNQFLEVGTIIIPFVLFFSVVINFLASKGIDDYLRRYVFSLVVFIPMVITWGDTEFAFWLSSAHLLSTILSLYDASEEEVPEVEMDLSGMPRNAFSMSNLLRQISLKPAQVILFSFAGVILLGTFLLMLPIASATGESFSFVDSLFMASSAVCVTGLSTISIGTQYSLFGQGVTLLLIQIGGLSIMTFYASMTIILGRSMGMKSKIMMLDIFDAGSLEDVFNMIFDIIKYTLVIELWGGLLLTVGFVMEGFEFGQALYYGIFHSVSAFCNAGFSLFDTSLESFGTKPLIHGTIMVLVVLGGLGFTVLKELRLTIIGRRAIVRLTAHTKIVIVTSAILIFSAAVFIFFGEFLNALDGYTLWEKMQISLFQSVTLRTAGFNSIPLGNLHSYTLYMMCLYMFIGGSPGSTAGGIKTTTLAILIQSIVATIKNERSVHLFDRQISPAVVVRTIAITFISLILVSVFILVMMRLESKQSFLSVMFEVVSASGTVGLSLGITTLLSSVGKLTITLVMFIGRIGPLTLLLAIGQRENKAGKFDYPEGRIMIG